jgi:hypothetical protein
MRLLILALMILTACSDPGGSRDTTVEAEPDTTLDTLDDSLPDLADEDIRDVEEDTGPGPLLSGVSFVQLGRPPAGHPVITDLEVFAGRIYLTTSINPLGEFGANVFHTTDGSTFTQVINDPTSQGFLRLRVIDDVLYIPDGDPNGYDPSYVHISTNGDDFLVSSIIGSVHTFDVILYMDDLLTSNGMMSGSGSLCRSTDPTSTPWTEVEATPYSRLKYMGQVNGRLFTGKRSIGSPADLVTWSGDVDTTDGTGVDLTPGEAITWRFHSTPSGRLFWSHATSTSHTMYTDDGETWTTVWDLEGEFISDFTELDGNLYALSNTGLWGSADHSTFIYIAAAPSSTTFGPIEVPGGYNAEAGASMTTYESSIYCGSSSDGHLYRVE